MRFSNASARASGLPVNWDEYEDVPRVWVKTDPSETFPRGCEAAVECACLVVLDPGEA